MKRFTFSLEKIRELKTQMLDREKNTLAELRRELASIDGEILELEREFRDRSRRMKEKAQDGVTVQELRSCQVHLDSIRYDIRELRRKHDAQERRVEAQLAVVLEMSQSVSGLDKLKEYQLEEYRRETAKAEETEIAEFVSGKLIRAQRAASS